MFKLKDVLNNNGATLNTAGEAVSYKRGYHVSTLDLEIVKTRDLRKRHIKALLAQLPADAYLGIWINKGLAYIDQSVRFGNKRTAKRIGKQLKQISIWDWKKEEAVYL